MQIKGFQKLTALDFPDRIACTVFTSGCNLRCPFCHNASLVKGEGDDFDEGEIFSYLKKRKGILDGVCITGGEPLLQPDIKEFILKIRELGLEVKLDTNGTFPDKLDELISSSLLSYVAMDIKNSAEKYLDTCGVQNARLFDNIKKSIEILKQNRVEYEFRTTIVKQLHGIDDIDAIGRLIGGAKRWYLQSFTDSGDILSGKFDGHTKDVLVKMLEKARPYAEICDLRGV